MPLRVTTLLLSSLQLFRGRSDSSDKLPIEAEPLQILVTDHDGINALCNGFAAETPVQLEFDQA